MSEGTRSAEPAVAPIRHRLAVRPVLVSLSAKPKFPRRLLDKSDGAAPKPRRKRTKHRSRNKHKREKKQVAAESSKQDSHFWVQIPQGPLVKVPAGVPYCRIQHGNYKYSLLVDPDTGELRHVHKRAT